MKALRYIIPGLLIAAVAGLMCYQAFVEQQLESRNLVRGILIIAGAILTMIRVPKHKVVNKKAVYQKAYDEFIQNAFYDDPKLEKQFYKAVHNYAQSKPSAAISKLEKLRRESHRTNDLRAVTVFTALVAVDVLNVESSKELLHTVNSLISVKLVAVNEVSKSFNLNNLKVIFIVVVSTGSSVEA